MWQTPWCLISGDADVYRVDSYRASRLLFNPCLVVSLQHFKDSC